ncbi:MAG: YezD family protein, partial [Verrucomicrobiia bacterium]
MNENQINPAANAGERPDWLEIVRRQVGSLRYGVVQVVVHDSQVTQIDKTER